ncbi:MAG: LuxR C-terminal-related transcriptional regulator [Parasphingorhabdus sp.]
MSQAITVEAQNSPKWFSRSKTRAPKFSIDLVVRKRLLLALDDALDKPISCIVAPAGFGKSTLLSQWRESLLARDIPCAWINLDENDSEIRQFFAYLIFAFEDAGVSLGYLKKAAESGFVEMSSSSIIISLLTAIGEIDEHMVLILDDYHRASGDGINDFVHTLSDQFGDKIHIALGSRNPVDIGLPALLAAGQAIEIPSTNLRFSNREVTEAMGSDLDQEALAVLQEQLEGWPVAVQMTKLLGRTKGLGTTRQSRLVGSHGHLADYLVTNVLEALPSDLKDFVLATSILESFNAELANAVCDLTSSQSLIHQLESLQALVVPLDDDLEWFRYHHLFSECLSDVLKQQDPDKFVELHLRAARWCGENQLIAEAVNYANSIKDYDLSKQIINDHSEWMRRKNFGGVGYLNGLLANIPETEILNDPRILYLKCFVVMMSGNPKKALQYHDFAESIIEREGTSPETLRDRLHIGSTILIRAGIGTARGGGWLNDRLEIAKELARSNPADRYVCGSIRILMAGLNVSYGEFDSARTQALAAEVDRQQLEAKAMGIYIEITLAVIELWSNDLDKARQYLRKATGAAVESGGDNSNLNMIGEICLKAIDYWQSDIESGPVVQLEQTLASTLNAEGWYNIYNIGFDAVIHDAICRRDFDKADELVKKLEEAVNRLNIARLGELTQLLRLDCAVAKNEIAEATMIFEKVQNWLNVDERKLDDLGWFVRSFAGYSIARYLGAVGDYEEALAYVENGLDEADRLDIVLLRVRGNILKASLLEEENKKDEALTILEYAIEDAAKINCPKTFACDVSETLLAKAVLSIMDNTQTHTVKDFAARLAVAGTQKLLSSREKEVLQGISHGRSNKEIARDLDLTDNTIKFHLRNIYQKLGVKKRVPAVEKARELGVLK